MDIDYNRLRAVRTGKSNYRGCGKTFSMCMGIVSHMKERGDDNIEIRVGRKEQIPYIRKMILDIAEARGLIIVTHRYRYIEDEHGNKVTFITKTKPGSMSTVFTDHYYWELLYEKERRRIRNQP